MDDKNHTDVKKLTPEEVVKSNPKIYWGVETPTYEVIDDSILSQLKEFECKNLSVHDLAGWHIISSDTNWFASSNKRVNELFNTAHWLPGGGGNGFRFEYFLNIIASDVCVFKENYLHQIKGAIEQDFSSEIVQRFKGKTFVAYKLEKGGEG